MTLAPAHRVQTLSKIKIDDTSVFDNRLETLVWDVIKTSAINSEQPKLVIPFFVENVDVCVESTLLAYLNKTKDLRGNIKNLFITHRKPFRVPTTQTLARWIKRTLSKSGIDTSRFTAHSVRHAACSAAFRSGISISTIRANAV